MQPGGGRNHRERERPVIDEIQSVEEIEAFSTTQMCPCHFRLRGGEEGEGDAHYTVFSLSLMRADEN